VFVCACVRFAFVYFSECFRVFDIIFVCFITICEDILCQRLTICGAIFLLNFNCLTTIKFKELSLSKMFSENVFY
jgi:hypothetical protein